MALDRIEGLLAVPGTAARPPQARHNRNRLSHRRCRIGRSSIRRVRLLRPGHRGAFHFRHTNTLPRGNFQSPDEATRPAWLGASIVHRTRNRMALDYWPPDGAPWFAADCDCDMFDISLIS